MGIEEVMLEKDFIVEATRSITETFKVMGINVENPPMFDDYLKYQKEYEIEMSYHNFDKSYEARKNDLNMILYLAKEVQQDEDEISPYLISWDSSFYKVRTSFRKFNELGYWYIYSPQKFSNTLSILNFKVDPMSVNNNIISLVEENFNASNETISFIDLLNGLFDKDDLSEWILARKFAAMRDQLAKEEDDRERVESRNLPIDELLLLVQSAYQNNSIEKIEYPDLMSLFKNNDYSDKIMAIFNEYIHDFKSDNRLKQEIIDKMNILILENKEKQKIEGL